MGESAEDAAITNVMKFISVRAE
jgi:hypothetical protein